MRGMCVSWPLIFLARKCVITKSGHGYSFARDTSVASRGGAAGEQEGCTAKEGAQQEPLFFIRRDVRERSGVRGLFVGDIVIVNAKVMPAGVCLPCSPTAMLARAHLFRGDADRGCRCGWMRQRVHARGNAQAPLCVVSWQACVCMSLGCIQVHAFKCVRACPAAGCARRQPCPCSWPAPCCKGLAVACLQPYVARAHKQQQASV